MNNEIITHGSCSGCHACYSVCPRDAIVMEENAEGFPEPRIRRDLCVECGLCRQVCPVNQQSQPEQYQRHAYAAMNHDLRQREESSSGGVFVLLASHVIALGGVVYGAGFADDFSVRHIRAETDVTPLQTSKYVQSIIGDSFRQADADLRRGRTVLFTGTPCQIAGLYNYLRIRKTDCGRLYLVDLICHGVPSPLVWRKYLEQTVDTKAVRKINFRDKSRSWGGFSLRIAMEDGSSYLKQASEDPYMRGFFANLTLRSSCYACAQKKTERVSDLTIADCWGVDRFASDMYDGKGTSAVIVHSEKGNALLREVADGMHLKELELETVLRYNRAARESVTAHPRRKRFFATFARFDGADVAGLMDSILAPTLSDRIKMIEVRIKRFVKKRIGKTN